MPTRAARPVCNLLPGGRLSFDRLIDINLFALARISGAGGGTRKQWPSACNASTWPPSVNATTQCSRSSNSNPRRKSNTRSAHKAACQAGWAASKEDVEAMLSDAGCAVSSMRYHTDAETGQFRGFVHAELADESSLQNALALAGTRWRGRELRVSHSETGRKR